MPIQFFVHNQNALGHIENATEKPTSGEGDKAVTTQVMHSAAHELDVQRRDICAQLASQAQQ